MLLAEDRLDVLIDRFRRLGPGDRRAILRRLDFDERARVNDILRGDSGGEPPALPYTRDIAERIAARATDTTMTAAGRSALAAAVARNHPAATRPSGTSTTLADAVSRWFRREA